MARDKSNFSLTERVIGFRSINLIILNMYCFYLKTYPIYIYIFCVCVRIFKINYPILLLYLLPYTRITSYCQLPNNFWFNVKCFCPRFTYNEYNDTVLPKMKSRRSKCTKNFNTQTLFLKIITNNTTIPDINQKYRN